MTDFIALPSKPGTVIAVGNWWLVKLRPHKDDHDSRPFGDGAWELLPMETTEETKRAKANGVPAQCVYSSEWVMAEVSQEGGYLVISEPSATPFGPFIISAAAREADLIRRGVFRSAVAS